MNRIPNGSHKSLDEAIAFALCTTPVPGTREAWVDRIRVEIMEFINNKFSTAVLQAEAQKEYGAASDLMKLHAIISGNPPKPQG